MKRPGAYLLVALLACSEAPRQADIPPPPPKSAAALPATKEAKAASASAPASQEAPCQNPPPEGFVDLAKAIPGIALSIGYATKENFTGEPLPGYGAPGAWYLEEPAAALTLVQEDLAKEGLGLLIYDAYRPRRATDAMVEWAESSGKTHLLDQGYIARKSGHNLGHALDLTLIDLKTKTPLDMGTPWDHFSEDSHTKNAEGAPKENRETLRRAMTAHGFSPYEKEWWHFSFPTKGNPPRDVPYGCGEVPEVKKEPK